MSAAEPCGGTLKVVMEEIEELADVEERYELLRQAGSGGQADLYVGRERESGRKVAIKVQKPWAFESMAYFRDIGKILAEEGVRTRQLAATAAVPELIATGWYGNRRCLVMEFVEGKLLYDVLISRRPIRDVGTVASVIGQLCEILHAVHGEKLVHRDVKPENIIVEPDGRLRLLDMGLAVGRGEPFDICTGTLGYVPPEQFDPDTSGLTGRADIFALGCILLEMTVMRLPYGGMHERPTHDCPVLPDDRLAAIPRAFLPLALRMVEREPERRPADVREVFAHLRPYVPAVGSRPPVKPLRPDPTEYYRSHPPKL